MFGYILSPHVNPTDVGDPGFSWPTGFNQIVGGQHYSLNGAIELSLGVFNGCGHESTRALGEICSPGPEIMNILDLKHAVINIQTQRLISKVMAWGMLSFIPYTGYKPENTEVPRRMGCHWALCILENLCLRIQPLYWSPFNQILIPNVPVNSHKHIWLNEIYISEL